MNQAGKVVLATVLMEEFEDDMVFDVAAQLVQSNNQVEDGVLAARMAKPERQKHFRLGHIYTMEEWINRYLEEDFHRTFR